jgi:polysaccharide chain length determinant protein (PEP-CTERM system associated)
MNEKANIARKISEFWRIAVRRKWSIIIPVLISVPLSFAAFFYIPKVYQAATLILVQPQKVPQEYVRSTVTAPVTERLATIRQEILNRTSLEKVIVEFDLYSKERKTSAMEEVIEFMREKININVHGKSGPQTTFSVSFEGNDPLRVMNVTNKLTDLFIQANLHSREVQAAGTSDFLTNELKLMEQQLKGKESGIREFKEKNMGQLPQQLDANLRILERMQQQLQTTSEAIKVSDEKIFLCQNQIEQLEGRMEERAKAAQPNMQTSGPGSESSSTRAGEEKVTAAPIPEDPLVARLNRMKRELGDLRLKYKDNHPDILNLKSQIAALEPKVKEILEEQRAVQEARQREHRARLAEEERRAKEHKNSLGNLRGVPVQPARDPALERSIQQYQDQLNEARLQAVRLRSEAEGLKEQIKLYQARIEETPKREQQLTLLARDYDLFRGTYQSLLEKKTQSQMAENLERKQQSEQFKVLDPARMPEKPIRPQAHIVFPAGIVLGLMLGGALAWLRESMDESFHSEEELEIDLGLPILATLPNLKEERNRSALS